MQGRVETHLVFHWGLVTGFPCIQKRIGSCQEKSFRDNLRPLAIQKPRAHIANVPKTDIGGLC